MEEGNNIIIFRALLKVSLHKVKLLLFIFASFSALQVILHLVSLINLHLYTKHSVFMKIQNIYLFVMSIPAWVGLAFGFFIAALLFRRYINPTFSDEEFTIPQKRRAFYLADIIVGFLVFFIPQILQTLFRFLIQVVFYFTAKDSPLFIPAADKFVSQVLMPTLIGMDTILYYMLGFSLSVLLIIGLRNLVSACTGYIAIMFIPYFFDSIIAMIRQGLLGFDYSTISSNMITLSTTPLSILKILYRLFSGGKNMIIYPGIPLFPYYTVKGGGFIPYVFAMFSALSVLIILAGYFLFRKLYTDNKIRGLFRTFVSRMSMIILSFYAALFACNVLKYSFSTTKTYLRALPIMLVAGILTMVIIQIAYAKGFRKFYRMLPSCVGVVILIGAVGISIYTGGLGAVARIPKSETIESVTVSFSGFDNQEYETSDARTFYIDNINAKTEPINKDNILVKKDESLQTVFLVHQALLDFFKSYRYDLEDPQLSALLSDSENRMEREYIRIQYRSKKGNIIPRNYPFVKTPLVEKRFSELKASVGLQPKDVFPELLEQIENMESGFYVSFRPVYAFLEGRQDDSYVTYLTGIKLAQLLRAIREDESSLSDEEKLNPPEPEYCQIGLSDYRLPPNLIHHPRMVIRSNYVNTIDWIKSQGLSARLSPKPDLSGGYTIQIGKVDLNAGLVDKFGQYTILANLFTEKDSGRMVFHSEAGGVSGILPGPIPGKLNITYPKCDPLFYLLKHCYVNHEFQKNDYIVRIDYYNGDDYFGSPVLYLAEEHCKEFLKIYVDR